MEQEESQPVVARDLPDLGLGEALEEEGVAEERANEVHSRYSRHQSYKQSKGNLVHHHHIRHHCCRDTCQCTRLVEEKVATQVGSVVMEEVVSTLPQELEAKEGAEESPEDYLEAAAGEGQAEGSMVKDGLVLVG